MHYTVVRRKDCALQLPLEVLAGEQQDIAGLTLLAELVFQHKLFLGCIKVYSEHPVVRESLRDVLFSGDALLYSLAHQPLPLLQFVCVITLEYDI